MPGARRPRTWWMDLGGARKAIDENFATIMSTKTKQRRFAVKYTLGYALGAAALTALLSISASSSARADDIKPAVVFDMGGKFDKSFNEGVYNGVERFKKETGTDYVDFEITNETQFEQAHHRFAERGNNPIIGVGFSQADAVQKVAADYPKTDFTVIDG